MGGGECTDPHFLDLSTNWRSVVSFTPLSLYPMEESTWYPWCTRLCGPPNRCEHTKIWKFLTLPGLEFRSLARPAHSQSDYDTANNTFLSILILTCLAMRSDESWITSSYEKPSAVLYTNMLIPNANITLIIFLCLYEICGVHSAS
jgi:hypothetical protein